MGVVVVDVEMVGVGGRHHGDMGMQLQEGAVEFVGLGHQDRILAQQQVGVVILGDAAQECVAAFARSGQDMGEEGTGRGLAMGARYGEAFLAARDFAKGFRAFAQGIAVAADILEFAELFRNRRRIDDKGMGDVFRDGVDVILVVDGDALSFECVRKGRRRTVVARHFKPAVLEVPCDGTHADPADSDKIIIRIHHSSFPA